MTTRADTGSKLDSPSATTAHSDSTTDSGRTAALGGAVSDAAVTVRDVAAETAAGLLIGGAPRVIVVGAFIPAVAMVLTMFNRANPGRGAVGRSMQGR